MPEKDSLFQFIGELSGLTQTLARIPTDTMTGIMDEAYSQQLQSHIERKYLTKHNFDAESFLRLGKLKCTPEVYARISDKIDKEHFSLKFLVAGFGSDPNHGHICVIDGNGAPQSYSSMGFWAIGTGAPAALSALAFHFTRGDLTIYRSKEEALYFALAAKFMAESATGVGRSTFAVMISADEGDWSELVSYHGIKSIRKLWTRFGAPRFPKKQIYALIPSLIYRIKEKDPAKLINALVGRPGYYEKLDAKSKSREFKNAEAKRKEYLEPEEGEET